MDFTAVILAAGEGRRAGGYKPLWSLGNKLVIDRVIAAASSVCDEVRVVGGARFERLEQHVKEHHKSVTLLRNRNWKAGEMFSSVLKGLQDTMGPVFIHPSDIPGPGAGVYRALAQAAKSGHDEVLRPTFNGRPGHPILLSEQTANVVQRAPLSSNLRVELAQCRRGNVEVDDEFVLRDFDTIEDFRAIEALLKQ
jgi:molybdenum cofactor cytidylyltransferase